MPENWRNTFEQGNVLTLCWVLARRVIPRHGLPLGTASAGRREGFTAPSMGGALHWVSETRSLSFISQCALVSHPVLGLHWQVHASELINYGITSAFLVVLLSITLFQCAVHHCHFCFFFLFLCSPFLLWSILTRGSETDFRARSVALELEHLGSDPTVCNVTPLCFGFLIHKRNNNRSCRMGLLQVVLYVTHLEQCLANRTCCGNAGSVYDLS